MIYWPALHIAAFALIIIILQVIGEEYDE